MIESCWLVLAAHYPPHHIGGGELSDQAIFQAAADMNVSVTVLVDDFHRPAFQSTGNITVIRQRGIGRQLKLWCRRLKPDRVIISGVPGWPIKLAGRLPKLTVFLRAPSSLPYIASLATNVDRCLVPSLWFKGEVERAYPILQGRVAVSYPSLKLNLHLQRPDSTRRFIAIASAESHKGIDMFLALADRINNREWLVADNLHPVATAALRRELTKHPNISLLTKHRSMNQVYFLSDLLLMPSVPSRHVETFGRVAAEALSWGVLPLAYNLGGPADWLPAGCLVSRRNDSFTAQLNIWQEVIDRFSGLSGEALRSDLVRVGRQRLAGMKLEDSARQAVRSLLN